MAFTTRDDVAIDGADTSIFVFVKFLEDGNPKFAFFEDAAAAKAYPSHDFEVPVAATGAVYFWLTADSDADAKFTSGPCAWASGQPATINDAFMTTNRKGFSLRVNNWSPHTADDSSNFQLVVEDGQGNPHTSQTFEVDPTIIEKGDPGTF